MQFFCALLVILNDLSENLPSLILPGRSCRHLLFESKGSLADNKHLLSGVSDGSSKAARANNHFLRLSFFDIFVTEPKEGNVLPVARFDCLALGSNLQLKIFLRSKRFRYMSKLTLPLKSLVNLQNFIMS